MNQVLKDRVYTQGNIKWVDYVAELSDMDVLEKSAFRMLHQNQTDLTIQKELGLSAKAFAKLEESIAKKLLWSVLYCVDFTMKNSG